MTNPMFSPQPNYSGVTIQIANPTVNTNPYFPAQGFNKNVGYVSCPQAYYCNPQDPNNAVLNGDIAQNSNGVDTGYQNAYPAQYYLNNYNYQGNGDLNTTNPESANHQNVSKESSNISDKSTEVNKNNGYITEDDSNNNYSPNEQVDNIENSSDKFKPENNESSAAKNSALKHYDTGKKEKDISDMTKSTSIIEDIDEREAKINEEKKNQKETKIVALTDEYIKSLENYLNNPNDEIRLMASKEILTRLDEDKDRYDDAALNALLNKMLQDPSKLVRIAALSAFAAQLACGNDYTVVLLKNIQSNPSADKEDVLQAADILLKMSAGTEVKNIPTPQNNK